MAGVSLGHGRVIRATDRALQVATDDHGLIWIPKSVIHDDSEVYDDNHEGDLVVKEWYAEKEGLV